MLRLEEELQPLGSPCIAPDGRAPTCIPIIYLESTPCAVGWRRIQQGRAGVSTLSLLTAIINSQPGMSRLAWCMAQVTFLVRSGSRRFVNIDEIVDSCRGWIPHGVQMSSHCSQLDITPDMPLSTMLEAIQQTDILVQTTFFPSVTPRAL